MKISETLLLKSVLKQLVLVHSLIFINVFVVVVMFSVADFQEKVK